MPRAVVGAGPYKGTWYRRDKLQFPSLIIFYFTTPVVGASRLTFSLDLYTIKITMTQNGMKRREHHGRWQQWQYTWAKYQAAGVCVGVPLIQGPRNCFPIII